MLNIFLCAYWPFVYLLWRNVQILCPFLDWVIFLLSICKAVLGKTFTTNTFTQAPAGYDTTYMKAGTNTGRTVLRADEWCVRNPDMVAPEYIVDMTVKNR